MLADFDGPDSLLQEKEFKNSVKNTQKQILENERTSPSWQNHICWIMPQKVPKYEWYLFNAKL